jgi:hypothetical protein
MHMMRNVQSGSMGSSVLVTTLLLISVFITLWIVPFQLSAAPFVCDQRDTQNEPEDCHPDGVFEQEYEFVSVLDNVFSTSNPIFNTHFDIFVCWDYTAGDAPWNADSLRAFADSIINPSFGDERGMAKSILDYFGEDVNASSDSFAVKTNMWTTADTTYTKFKVYMFDEARHIHAKEDWLSVHIDGGGGTWKSVWAVVRDAFAHEWQHVCEQTWERTDRRRIATSGFNELRSMLSVAMFGKEDAGDSDQLYENTICQNGVSSFAGACMNAIPIDMYGASSSDTCLSRFGTPYNDFAMFAIYLNNGYSLGNDPADELVYRWIRTSTTDVDTTVYHHDFVGLGTVLNETEFNDFFSLGAGPHQRVQEVFRSYALAKFLNLQTVGYPNVPQYQWSLDGADPDGYRPQELYNYLQDMNGNCYDNIHCFPLYHQCTQERQALSGWQYSRRHWACPDSSVYEYDRPEWKRQRMVEVQTLASNYIVLLPPDDDEDRLYFSLRFLDHHECMECLGSDETNPFYFTDKSTDYEGHATLAVDFISYDNLPEFPPLAPGGPGGLDYHGDKMTGVETYWVEPGYNQIVGFSLDAFDQGADAVAVVISQVPTNPVERTPPIKIIPYEYRFEVLPDTIPFWSGEITDAATFAADSSYWINGDLIIRSTGSLTMESGARVYFCSSQAKITVDGGALMINGSAGSLVELMPSNLPEYTNTTYAGIFAENGGQVEAQHCILGNLIHLEADEGQVEFADSWLIMADDDDNSIELDLVNTEIEPVFKDVIIRNVNTVHLTSEATKAAVIEGTSISQRPDLQSLLALPFPLVTLYEGTLKITESELRFLKTGIEIGEKFWPDSSFAELGPELLVRPLDSVSGSTTGLVVTGIAVVDLDDCRIEEVSTGVKVWGSAQLTMLDSKLHGAEYGVANYAMTGSVVLGDSTSAGSNFIAPFDNVADCWVKSVGQRCDEAPDSVDMVRIYNATPDTIQAYANAWGTCDQWDTAPWSIDCLCPTAFFKPNSSMVRYDPWTEQFSLSACSSFGGGAFHINEIETDPPPEPEGAWPNPFNGSIQFLYRAHGKEAVLEIFDIAGRRVQALAGTPLDGGDRRFVWRGDTIQGRSASSGVYLYRIVGGPKPLKGKVVYVK